MSASIIVIVEAIEQDTQRILQALEYARIVNPIVVMQNGREACDYIFGQGPFAYRAQVVVPLLVLLDFTLPVLSGIEVLRRLRQDPRTRLCKVVALDGSIPAALRSSANDLGLQGYLHKPVDSKQLLQLFQQLHLCCHLT